ncbi:hypothetical protein GCM10028822_18230 [Hymenobacter terrigena]
MSEIEPTYLQEDLRPAFVLGHVSGATLHDIRVQKAAGESAIVLTNVKDFAIADSQPVADFKTADVAQKELP